MFFIAIGRSPLKSNVLSCGKSLLGRMISSFKVHQVFQVHDSSALGESIISWHMLISILWMKKQAQRGEVTNPSVSLVSNGP